MLLRNATLCDHCGDATHWIEECVCGGCLCSKCERKGHRDTETESIMHIKCAKEYGYLTGDAEHDKERS